MMVQYSTVNKVLCHEYFAAPLSLSIYYMLVRSNTIPSGQDSIRMTVLREKLGRLGGTPLRLGTLSSEIHGEPLVPMAMLNQMRRELVATVLAKLDDPPPRRIETESARRLLEPIDRSTPDEPSTKPGKARLAVLCRTLEQIEAAWNPGACFFASA